MVYKKYESHPLFQKYKGIKTGVMERFSEIYKDEPIRGEDCLPCSYNELIDTVKVFRSKIVSLLAIRNSLVLGYCSENKLEESLRDVIYGVSNNHKQFELNDIHKNSLLFFDEREYFLNLDKIDTEMLSAIEYIDKWKFYNELFKNGVNTPKKGWNSIKKFLNKKIF